MDHIEIESIIAATQAFAAAMKAAGIGSNADSRVGGLAGRT